MSTYVIKNGHFFFSRMDDLMVLMGLSGMHLFEWNKMHREMSISVQMLENIRWIWWPYLKSYVLGAKENNMFFIIFYIDSYLSNESLNRTMLHLWMRERERAKVKSIFSVLQSYACLFLMNILNHSLMRKNFSCYLLCGRHDDLDYHKSRRVSLSLSRHVENAAHMSARMFADTLVLQLFMHTSVTSVKFAQ